jgi:hypothetical protein
MHCVRNVLDLLARSLGAQVIVRTLAMTVHVSGEHRVGV